MTTQRDREAAQPAGAPHPVLPAYYGRPEQRRGFVRQIFDSTAGDYDRVERMMSLGSGSWYRRSALRKAGLRPGMRVLDVAVGTGLVAREAVAIAGDAQAVIGLDPSNVMMRSGPLQALRIPLVQGVAERIPLPDQRIDFLSMGFALRHVADLETVFREYYRVLRPGGIVCVLELTPPTGPMARQLLKLYMRSAVPLLSLLIAKSRGTPQLFRYFWDTIEACVPPARVLHAMRAAGFANARRKVEARIFSEYTAVR